MRARECYRRLADLLAGGSCAATATVVRTKGSVPREPGAKMLIRADGRFWGTVGGGCGEADVLAEALELLGIARPGHRIVRVDLTEDLVEGAERICGGIMDVLVECWCEPFPEHEVLAGTSSGAAVRVIPLASPLGAVTVYRPGAGGPLDDGVRRECDRAIAERRSRTTQAGEAGELFVELVSSGLTLLICGAGHIAQPLSVIGKLLDLRVVILDDRPEFACHERFAEADVVMARPFYEAFDELEISEETVAVLVTRGHRHDELCLRRLLDTPASYIGMLGSRRRVRAVFESLLEDGYTREQLDRVWAPVGVDIGANSPAEIAISIAAELVALQRGRLGGHLRVR